MVKGLRQRSGLAWFCACAESCVVFNTGPYTVLPDSSVLNQQTCSRKRAFHSHQLKSYIASKSHLKLAARAVLSADAGFLVCVSVYFVLLVDFGYRYLVVSTSLVIAWRLVCEMVHYGLRDIKLCLLTSSQHSFRPFWHWYYQWLVALSIPVHAKTCDWSDAFCWDGYEVLLTVM